MEKNKLFLLVMIISSLVYCVHVENVIKEEVTGVTGKQIKEAGNTQAYFPFGRPGAGAPRRDEEGRILTTLARKLTREVRTHI